MSVNDLKLVPRRKPVIARVPVAPPIRLLMYPRDVFIIQAALKEAGEFCLTGAEERAMKRIADRLPAIGSLDLGDRESLEQILNFPEAGKLSKHYEEAQQHLRTREPDEEEE